MRRLLLLAALAASLLVPAGAVTLAVAAVSSPTSTPTPGSATPTEVDKDDIVAIYNELEALDRRAKPRSPGQIAEAQRIAREANAWAAQWDAEPEWEEFASATGALATLMAAALEHPRSFSAPEYDRAVDRLVAAGEALPEGRQPQD